MTERFLVRPISCYHCNDALITANVGDSPIWLIHNGGIESLFVLHTAAAEQAALYPGEKTNLGPEFRHVLTRAIGIEARVKADVFEVPCFVGDILVMASDGLSGKVSSEEILDLARRAKPEKACRLLVDMANERGGDDNITVIVTRVTAIRPGARSVMARVWEWFRK
jgi:serine/threonine protein phosphatase PrpC